MDFCSSYHNLYSSSKEITKSGIATSLIELSVFGVFVNTPLSAKYWLERFILIMPVLKSTSCHSNPINSPSLTPVNTVKMIATLYLIWSSPSDVKFSNNTLHCSSS